MNCMAYAYYDVYICHINGQMHMSLIASSVKIITKHNINIFAMYRFTSARMVSC